MATDHRNRLEGQPFSYRKTKNGTIFVDYEGRTIKIMKGAEAERFMERIRFADEAGGGARIQLELAKATGNFKRGNEKLVKQKR